MSGIRSSLPSHIAGHLDAFERSSRAAITADVARLLEDLRVALEGAERVEAEESRFPLVGANPLVGMVSDLGECRRSLAVLMDNVPGLVYRCRYDASWTMEFVSTGSIDLTGYAADELLHNRVVSYADLIHPDDRDAVSERVHAAVAERRPFILTYRVVTRAGEQKWVWERGRGIYDGPYLRALEGFVTDITEQKQAEHAVRDREAYFRALIENASDIVTVLDHAGTIRFISPAVESILGYAPDEVLGRDVFAFVNPADADALRGAYATLLSGEDAEPVEGRFGHKDSTWRVLRLTGSNLLGNPAVGGIVLTARDVTERRARERLQEQLRHVQRIEAVGQLAGGIAHDFNNLLTAIKGNTQLALLDVPEGSSVREDLREIDRTVDRAVALTRQLLAFSRKQVARPEALDLGEIVANLEPMLRRLIGEHIELLSTWTPGTATVTADPGQMEQVITNLVLNARDAMPKGGTIHVEVAAAPMPEEAGRFYPYSDPGADAVLLRVTDTGTGMDEEVQSRLFEPFFTTKEQGKGTGLGLSTVYGIVKQGRGYLFVDSAVGEGTTFRIYLPRSTQAVHRTSSTVAVATVGGSETILLVEDERGVRELAERVLRGAGYTLLVASNGAEALEMVASRPRPLDLLLTDVVMPRMGGKELADRLHARWAGLKILFMSGYAEDAITSHGVVLAGMRLLEKPFSPDDLLRAVRTAVDAAD